MQKKWPLIVALVVGVIVMGASYYMVQKQVEVATTTVNIVVPKTTIESHSLINSDNLTTLAVPPNVVDDNTATKTNQLNGKITTTPLYPGKPVDLRVIAEKTEDIGNKQVVGVYIDAARCAGVTEGDIVDVYRLTQSSQGEAAPMIALNCKVLRITDDKGVPVRGASAIFQGVSAEVGMAKNPRIVYLLISPAEVPYVIQGSIDKPQIALSKKGKESIVKIVETEEEKEE